jgi:hypothetical protein
MFFSRMANGWELAKESLRVLRLDKELLVFPLVSGISCILVLASFAIPLWNSPFANVIFNEGEIPNDPVAYLILFLFYLVNYFVIVFFNSGLVACAIIRFKGGDPTVGDGFRAAMNRLPQIFAWAVVSATVGLILRVIESRSERAGQFAAALLGAAWSLATYFVVPVLVVEQAGPLEATKRSLSIIRRTWGESLAANFSVGLIFFLASLIGFIPLILGIMLLVNSQVVLGTILLFSGILSLIAISLVSSAVNSILIAGLYLFAAEGSVPQSFDNNLLRNAFSPTE